MKEVLEIERLRDSLILKDREAEKRIKSVRSKRIKEIEETNKEIFKYVPTVKTNREKTKQELKEKFDVEEEKLKALSHKMAERRRRLEN